MKKTLGLLTDFRAGISRYFKKNKFQLGALTLAVATAPAVIPSSLQAQSKPNVLVVLADDQGMGDWSWFGEHPYLAGKTPNMEKLINDGVFLTNFHSMPLCGPSRACLMSGRHSNYVRAWQGRHHMRADVATMADMFKANGYKTAMFGKWHLAHGYPYGPEYRGFDESIIFGGGMFGDIEDHRSNNMMTLENLTLRHNGNFEYYSGASIDIWFDNAEKFMQDSVTAKKPFFIYIAPEAPHAPHISHYHKNDFDGIDFKKEDGTDFTEDDQARGFYGQIMDLDDKLGEIRQKIKDLGIEDNTILWYMSDNGSAVASTIFNGSSTHYSTQPLNVKGHKAESTEGGHRVPSWVYWKGHIEGGYINSTVAHMIDVIPTLYSLCGLTNSPWQAGELEGQDVSPILLSPTGSLPSDDYYRYASYSATFDPPSNSGAILWTHYSLLGNGQMFDLSNDIHQDNKLDTKDSAIKPIKDAMNAAYLQKLNVWRDTVYPFPDAYIIGSDKNLVNDITDGTGGKMDYMFWNASTYVNFWADMNEFKPAFGKYWIQAEKPGNYKFHFYRWFYVDQTPINNNNPAGTPQMTQLHLIIPELGLDKIVTIDANAVYAEIDLNLPTTNLTFDAKFEDASGNPVCSPYFISAQKLNDPANIPPVASGDSFQTPENTAINISASGILVNDFDAEGSALTAIKLTDPSHGSLTLNADGSFVYTPNTDFVGEDSFTYKANDGSNDSEVATVNIKVFSTAISKPLIAHWKLDETTGGVASDETGNYNATIKNLPDTDKGIPAVIDTGFKFDNPGGDKDNNFYLSLDKNTIDLTTKSFTYSAWVKLYSYTSDGYTRHAIFGGKNSPLFYIDVNGMPRMASQGYDGDSSKIAPAETAVPLNSWTHVAVSYDLPSKTFRYYVNGKPAGVDDWPADFQSSVSQLGKESLYIGWFDGEMDDLRIYDGVLSDDEIVTIVGSAAGLNNPPVGAEDSYSTTGNSVNIAAPGVLSNDQDFDNDNLTVQMAGGALHGVVTLNDNGSFVYTADSGFYGVDRFEYRVFDGQDYSDVTKVTIEVVQPAGNTYEISGTISGDVQQGVTVTADATHSAVSASDGTYTISGLVDGTYTVIPNLDGYTFNPVNQPVTISGANKTGIDFTSTSTASDIYSISGKITGDIQQGVTVSADATHSAVSDASGNYTISDLTDGTYNVVPALSGYTFSPANQSVNISGGNKNDVNFTASKNSGGGEEINAPTDIDGCNLWLDGADPKGDGTAFAGALDGWVNKADSGNVAFQANADNQASVVAGTLNGHSVLNFADGNQTYPIVNASDTGTVVEISVNTVFWVIKESDTMADGSKPTFLGHSTNYPFHRGASQDDAFDGKYWDDNYATDEVKNGQTYLDGVAIDGTKEVFPAGEYHIVSLVLTGPVQINQITQDRNIELRSWQGGIAEIITYNSALSDADRQSVEAYLNKKWFNIAPTTYAISGTITGDVQAGVTVTAGTKSATTGPDGKYTITGLADNETYTVKPTLTGYTFTPATASVTISGANQTGIDFSATSSGGGTQYTLTVNNGTGTGQYAENENVTISADVPAGQVFDAWTGDVQYLADASVPSTTVTMPAQNVTVNATFKEAPVGTHSISGKITGDIIAGVTVSVDATHSATTDVTGNYTISGLADGPYTVTPSLTGYTFFPTSQSVTINGSDVTSGADFTATADIVSQYTLTVNNGTGSGEYAEGATVTISADVPAGQVFDAWTGDVQYLADASVPSTTVTMPAQNVTVTATFKNPPVGTHNITGQIVDDNGAGISGVTVAIDDTHSAVTDANGNYTISGVEDGTYTLTPSKDGVSFNPTSTSITVAGNDVTSGTEFTGTPRTSPGTYTISGTITDNEGKGLIGVTVTAGEYSAITDEGGVFTITDVEAGAYNITPTLDDYTFNPVSIPVSTLDENLSNLSFTGTEGGIPETVNPPIAVEDSYFVQEGDSLIVNVDSGVLANDVDIDKTGKMIAVLDSAETKELSFRANGTFSYTPASGFVGKYTFYYHANNEIANSESVPVLITVVAKSEELPISAVGDTYNAVQGGILTVNEDEGVLVNDLNAPTNATVTLGEPPKSGKLKLDTNGSFIYEADDNFAGIVTFSYTIDGTDPISSAIVTINIAPVKITIGSLLTFTSAQVEDLDDNEFAKAPKLYGVFSDGKKGSLKKIKTSTTSEFSGVWGKKYTLYNKTLLKAGYASYFDKTGALEPVTVKIRAKGKTVDKKKIDSDIYPVKLVPPVITAITDSKDKVITTVKPGASIIIKGMYFGDKAPKVALEVNGKLLKCKVDKTGLSIPNYKNKLGAMNPVTGESSVTVILPDAKKLPKGEYPIILDNKIGIATTPEGKLPVIIIE